MEQQDQERQQALTCPECGAVFKNRAGLNGHRQFKHGIRPTAQLPLEPLDRIVTETRLADAIMQLDARLYEAIEQVSERVGQLKEQVQQAASTLEQLSSVTLQHGLQLNELAEELPGFKGAILSCQGRLNKLEPNPEPEPKPKPGVGSIFKQS